MRSLLLTPSPSTDDILVDAADWAEANALFRADGSVSREDLARALFRRSSIRELRARQIADDAFLELEDRVQSCGRGRVDSDRYPFSLSPDKTLLSLKRPFRINSNFGLLYWFLLFVTRADMSSGARVLDGTDPTEVFEQVCADVLGTFWGGESKMSGSMVMGTSAGGGPSSFKSRIEQLCENIGEGAGWRAGARQPGGGDAKLDVVAWRRFSDKRQGALLGFAQCKTGVNWRDHLTKLQPVTFSRRFMRQSLLLAPLRLYMVPHRIGQHRWEEDTSDGGLLFDRCRILQYSWRVSEPILNRCKKWVAAAYRRQKSRRVTI
jgi:hypothetical protein